MKFIMATKNRNKLAEMVRILAPIGVDVVIESDIGITLPEVIEDGLTFEENALIKARSACNTSGLPALADDSGLCVDYLNGAPGIYSARYAGEPSDSLKNNQKLLKMLEGVSEENRTARFVSAVACVFPDGREFTVRGECEGKIAFQPFGENGFGYDPLFISKLGRFGELSDAQKDSISHRGEALKNLVIALKEYL